MMAIQYLVVTIFDFILFPLLRMYYSIITDVPYEPWEPLTLMNDGLYHFAMATVLGIYVIGRSGEKIFRKE